MKKTMTGAVLLSTGGHRQFLEGVKIATYEGSYWEKQGYAVICEVSFDYHEPEGWSENLALVEGLRKELSAADAAHESSRNLILERISRLLALPNGGPVVDATDDNDIPF